VRIAERREQHWMAPRRRRPREQRRERAPRKRLRLGREVLLLEVTRDDVVRKGWAP